MSAHDPDTRRLAQVVALSQVPGLGARTIRGLLAHFGDLDAVFAAPRGALLAVPRIGPKLADAILCLDLERTAASLADWRAAGVGIAQPTDPAYPALLRALDDAPPVLFWRGALLPDDRRTAAIVGTRSPSAGARRMAGALAGALAACGCTVISGLAAGIDTAAHRGALEAGGRTVAVLGSGVDTIYPPGNRTLADRICAAGGALLAEVQPGTRANAPALVARNRIISGMSRALIVVEAGASSGSLHAARFAREQGRLVVAVASDAPGNRELIEQGARPLPPDLTAWEALAAEISRSEG